MADAAMARTVAAADDRKLADAISVYDKDRKQLHQGQLDAEQWKPQSGAAAAVA